MKYLGYIMSAYCAGGLVVVLNCWWTQRMKRQLTDKIRQYWLRTKT